MNSVDDILGFDPTNMEIFQETKRANGNENIYKTSTADSKSQDGNYYARVRLLMNPKNPNTSIVHSIRYAMSDNNGFFFADSRLALGDRNCPIFKAWKQLHFSGDPAKDEWAKQMFDKSESNWCLVQIIEDDNKPEEVGKIRCMKLPKAIFDKLQAKMNPSDGRTAPVNLLDYLFGPILNINVQAGPDGDIRRTNYNLCDFESDPCPIIKTDGTPLFSDEEIEIIENYDRAKKDYLKIKNDAKKTQKAKDDKLAVVQSLVDGVKPLMQKAIDYVKENACDIEEVCGYHEWSDELKTRVQNWISKVVNMQDPKGAVVETFASATQDMGVTMPAEDTPSVTTMDADLPF